MSDRHRFFTPSPAAILVVAAVVTGGCQQRPEMAPVSGKVLYKGEPLEFGIVMFQPTNGQIAQGEIHPDGTFSLSTFHPGDGVLPGAYNIGVLCYEGHNPNGPGPQEDAGGGIWLGNSLIPLKYTRARSSGLSHRVSLDQPNKVVLELKGRGP